MNEAEHKGSSSPAATGPGGAHFEGQVGAHYLLSMLVGAEPRGLPGTKIDRVEFQRAGEGKPLDDIVVSARDLAGRPAEMQIQVKREVTFAPADPVFKEVVGQIAEASRQVGFWDAEPELAIAIARSSRKIDGSYQDVLKWSRELGSHEIFLARIARKGAANDDMRSLVRTFRTHLSDFGYSQDDQSVWRLLRRIRILPFDYANPGSASEELAKERAVRTLHPDEAGKAASLWTYLTDLSMRIAISGGERDYGSLSLELAEASFRLAGEQRHAQTRKALSEDTAAALVDIGDRIGDVKLARTARLETVRDALDRGRYVEIRGDAGVGKSGILKHLAEETAADSRIVVLSPGRTAARWATMRTELAFAGTARELLSDLANDGGSTLFVDNLDFFGAEERNTVVDLLRAAAETPGMQVVATARRRFGSDEPSWLPNDALDALGRGGVVDIAELDEAEIDELRLAAPKLAHLLAERHPARDVARNLYRLARIASRHSQGAAPRTEVDMAEQWWRTADGVEEGRRERARVLRTLAIQALATLGPLDSRELPAAAIDELIETESVRDFGGEQIAFRHDVLREWAIANLFVAEPDKYGELFLGRPAPPGLVRGVELAARYALERGADAVAWSNLLRRMSADGVHGSWRRAVLLALVRSEIAGELLDRVRELLFEAGARMLRELIRTTMAVDAEPANEFLAAIGLDPNLIPAGLAIPRGPSWQRLIFWLIGLGDGLPAAVIPDVVDLYTAWSSGMIGLDPVTPKLLPWLFRWLVEIETARDGDFRERRKPFGGVIEHDRLDDLETSLRSSFLLFCQRTPELAEEYLRRLLELKHGEQIQKNILKFRGSLAQAAPARLAELTVAALIPKPKKRDRRRDRVDREVFSYFDSDFIPESPAQGPFLELLTHSPQHGLELVRKLVDHAIAHHWGDEDAGPDTITIPFAEGDRTFPRAHTYTWSRGCSHYALTSALMAVEAWAHKRIEAGEDFDRVLSDVLGPPGSPAAYLLLAVDLILSHWPKSREAAVPFAASPELLCADHGRSFTDGMKIPDALGLNLLRKEPAGGATAASLRARVSRKVSLDAVVPFYAVGGPEALRDKLTAKLRSAAERLGEPNADSNLSHPDFMVQHALNLADPANWPEVSYEAGDGTTKKGRQYKSPDREARHFERLQGKVSGRSADTEIESKLSLALDDPSHSPPDFAVAAVEWAKRAAASLPEGKGSDEEDWPIRAQKQLIATAAMIAMRDGTAEFRAGERQWAEGVFAATVEAGSGITGGSRTTLRYNAIAISFAGMIHALKHEMRSAGIRCLLEAATRNGASAAPGLAATYSVIVETDERLIRSILRCAFAAALRTHRQWDIEASELAVRTEARNGRLRSAVDEEMNWLEGRRSEPGWPVFPMDPLIIRRGFRLPGGAEVEEAPPRRERPEHYVEHRSAAAWLGSVRALFDVAARPWLRDLPAAYSDWTASANGAGLDMGADVDGKPREWNEVYFDLLANCLPGMPPSYADAFALDPIRSFPDKPFYDTAATFLRNVDTVYFQDRGIAQDEAVRIRTVLGDHLIDSGGWRWNARNKSSSIEMHLGRAIAVLFFNEYGHFQPPKAYLLKKGVDKLPPFLPALQKIASDGPCLFVAIASLNLFEISPRPQHEPFIISIAKGWIAAFPNDTDFWTNHLIGRRICNLLERLFIDENRVADAELRAEVDSMLAALVKVGIAEASRLEIFLAAL